MTKHVMPNRVELTAEIVDKIQPPDTGEIWISDLALKGFGIRSWASKRGGGVAYAIRTRDRNGKLVRETYPLWDDWHVKWRMARLFDKEPFDWTLGLFLQNARVWARERLSIHHGRPTAQQLRARRYVQGGNLVRSMTLDQLSDRTIRKLRMAGRNQDYCDNIAALFRHISPVHRSSVLEKIDERQLAEDITSRSIPTGSSRVLQAFIGQVFSHASRWHGPLGRNLKAIQRHAYTSRENRDEPPYPQIMDISEEDMRSFLDELEADETNWRTSLAIRFYFATGAKMRRVMAAKWHHIIDGTWYPYAPVEKRYWTDGREQLGSGAVRVLDLLRYHQRKEQIESAYLFPSKSDPSKPITTIRRRWRYISSSFGWEGLPLHHVVRRHRQRNTPSYLYSHGYISALFAEHSGSDELLSKVANAHNI